MTNERGQLRRYPRSSVHAFPTAAYGVAVGAGWQAECVLASTHASIVIRSTSVGWPAVRPSDAESYFTCSVIKPLTEVDPFVVRGPALIEVVGVPEVSMTVMFTVVSLQIPMWGVLKDTLGTSQMKPVIWWDTTALRAALPCPPTVVTVSSGQSI